MRKLASIQRILSLEPIPGAEAIEKATVLGWQVVVKKGEYQVGQLVVYCEIDSVMPDKPEYEFLKAKNMRIRTVRLRGQISQGICFPLSVLPTTFVVSEGADCTEALGVTKYELPEPANLRGSIKGKFPEFIPKTDETRVQVLQNMLDKYKCTECYVAEKLDGSSVTYYLKDEVFGVCSRNIELREDEFNTYWKVARKYDVENKLREYSKKNNNVNIALQGEVVGENIQGNKYKLKGHHVYFYNLFNIDAYKYEDVYNLIALTMLLKLPIVPIIDKYYLLDNDIPKLVHMATIKSTLNDKVWAEGIVVRPLEETIDMMLSMKDFNNGRVSFKVINPEFLLSNGE